MCKLTTLLMLLIEFGATQCATSGDSITAHCKPGICSPCFAREVSCLTKNMSEIVPQYLDPEITSLTLKFQSGNGRAVELQLSDVKRYQRLKVISLSGDFSSISVSALALLRNLTTFQLSGTRIDSLPNDILSSNENVSTLSFTRTSLTTIPVNIFPSSAKIQVSSFTFSGHSNVTLPCSNFSMILPPQLVHYHWLRKLVLEHNSFENPMCPNLTEEFFRTVEGISHLSLAGSRLPQTLPIALKAFRKLYILDISDLESYKKCPTVAQDLFSNIPNTVERLFIKHWETSQQVKTECIVTRETLEPLSKLRLKTLSLAYSDGIFGTILPKDLLPAMRFLEQLDLTSCRISIIELDALSKLPRLKSLRLTGNPLGPKDLDLLSRPLKTVRALNLINAEIRSDDSFTYKNSGILCDFPHLTTLNFNSNSLNKLPQFRSSSSNCKISTYFSLKALTATYNMLDSFVEQDSDGSNNICEVFPRLSYLSLSNNRLTNLTGLELCTGLKSLSLIGNKLSYYGNTLEASDLARIFRHLKELKNLTLESNYLREIDENLLAGMAKLTSFGISLNFLTKLSSTQFAGNKKLRYVDLSFNYLQSIDSGVFSGLNDLRVVDLSNNKLSLLSMDFLQKMQQFPSLKLLDIIDNPFYCGCDKAVQNWLQNHHNQPRALIFYVRCSTPKLLEGRLVYDYHEDNWDCHLQGIVTIVSSISGGFIITLAIALPCYKYRWYVKHARMVLRAIAGSLDLVKMEHVLPYDAYVSFDPKCQEDCDWVVKELVPAVEGVDDIEANPRKTTLSTARKHKLFLEPRDALGGTNRFTERATAVESCKRILIIVSNSYLKSTDCLSEADLTGLLMHGTEFYQPNRVLLLIREELSEEILKPPMSSLLLGKTLKVESDKRKKKVMWKKIRLFLSEPLYTYSKPSRAGIKRSGHPSTEDEFTSSDATPLLA